MKRAVRVNGGVLLTNTESGVIGYVVRGHWWGDYIEARPEQKISDTCKVKGCTHLIVDWNEWTCFWHGK